jgi:hypothetical protein
MSQAESEPITADTFAAFATWLGTPLPDDPITAIRILRKEAAAEIERLITMLDVLGGDPDLEPTMGYVAPGYVDEAEIEEDPEPSLGWTGTVNQASRNRLGDGEDFEKDDADKEDSDPAEESDFGELEPDLEADEDASDAPSDPEYATRLRQRRGQTERPDLSLVIIGPDGKPWEIDRLGYPVVR